MRLFKCLVPVLVLLFVEGSSAGPRPTTMRDIAIVRDTIQSGGNNPINVGTHNEGYANTAANAGSRDKVNQFPMTYRNQKIAPGQYAGWPFGTMPGWPFGAQGPSGLRDMTIVGNNSQVSNGGIGGHYEFSFASKADPKAGSSGVGGFGGNTGNTRFTSDGSASSGSSLGGHGGSNGGSFGVKVTPGAAATTVAPRGNRADDSTVSGTNQQGPTTMRDIAIVSNNSQTGGNNTINVGNHNEGYANTAANASGRSRGNQFPMTYQNQEIAPGQYAGWPLGAQGRQSIQDITVIGDYSPVTNSQIGVHHMVPSASNADPKAGSSGVGGFGGNAGNTRFISDGSASSGSSLGGHGGSNGGSFGVKTTAGAAATVVAPRGNRADDSTVSGTNQQGPTTMRDIAIVRDTVQSGTGNTINVGNHNERYANTAANADSRGKVNQFPMTYRHQEIAPGQYAGWPFGAQGPSRLRDMTIVGNNSHVTNGDIGGHYEVSFASEADPEAGSSGVGGSEGNAGNTGFTSNGSASSGSSLGGHGGSNGGSFDVKTTAGAAGTAVTPSGNRTNGSAVSGTNQQGPTTMRDIAIVSNTSQTGGDNMINVGNHNEGYANTAANAGSRGKEHQFPMTYQNQEIAPGQYAGWPFGTLPGWPFGAQGPLGLRDMTIVGNNSEVTSGNIGIHYEVPFVSKAGSSGVGGSNGGSFGVKATPGAVATAVASSGNKTDGSTVQGANQQGSSGGLTSAISNAHSNANGGLTSSSSKSTANGSGNAMAQSFSSPISTDGGNSSASS